MNFAGVAKKLLAQQIISLREMVLLKLLNCSKIFTLADPKIFLHSLLRFQLNV